MPNPSAPVLGGDNRSSPRLLLSCAPLTRDCSVGAVLLLPSELFCVPYETDDREADDLEENDSVDVGGDCGGSGTRLGSTMTTLPFLGRAL